MKLIAAIAAHLLVGFFIAWGILRAANGHALLLAAAVLVYALIFAKAGCLPKADH